jgi:hypothetical protein
MPIKLGKQTATFSGAVRIEDVDGLVAWLRETPKPSVNLRRCTHLHTAVLQSLLAAGVTVSGPPVDPFLHSWVLPALEPDDRSATTAPNHTPSTERAST